MEFKRYKLNDLSIDGGSYGIGASAVEYNKELYTYLRITDINEDGTLNYKDMMSVDDPKANQYVLKKNDICFARTGNSTGKSYFYDWANMPEELENIYNDIFKDFYIYPKDSKVTDVLGEDVVLLNKNTNELNPKIQIKHGEEIVEEITFNEAGTEAYSTLQQDKNIMTAEGDTYKIESNYVAYDSNSKTFSWNIGNIDNTGYSLEYFVYLTETVNLYNDGTSRQTGKYDTNKEAYLEYINHLNENIRKDFPVPQIDWKLINESGEVIKTGDNIIYYVSVLGILVLLLGINKIRKIVVK